MAAYYDQVILDVVAQSNRPLRHREIAELVAPNDWAAHSQIGGSLTKLYRAGLLAREKSDGRYWHYSIGGTPPRTVADMEREIAYLREWLRGELTISDADIDSELAKST